jgi:hypothetical protein
VGRLAGGALDEDELQRGLGDGEVGVAGAALGGFGAEQLGVELGTQGGDSAAIFSTAAFSTAAASPGRCA